MTFRFALTFVGRSTFYFVSLFDTSFSKRIIEYKETNAIAFAHYEGKLAGKVTFLSGKHSFVLSFLLMLPPQKIREEVLSQLFFLFSKKSKQELSIFTLVKQSVVYDLC